MAFKCNWWTEGKKILCISIIKILQDYKYEYELICKKQINFMTYICVFLNWV